VGGIGLELALAERGLVAVGAASDAPAAVVSGFSPDLAWPLLAEGAYALATGIPWVASNLDRTLPTPRGRAPGNGALVAALEVASGRIPLVAGKPEPPMHREAMLRTGAERPLVVGDRLDTDIEGAVRAQVPSLLVLSGVTDPVDVVCADARHRPTYLAEDLRGLLEEHPVPVHDQDVWRCGRARVAVASGRIAVVAGGAHRLDLLRAACAAVWTADVPPTRAAVEAALGPALA
jgi:ribonucleotide monophosphatase NagD (HAD superfamily)